MPFQRGNKLNLTRKKTSGWKLSKETCDKMRKAKTGKRGNNFGKKHTRESKTIISNKLKGKIPWNKGKEMTEEYKDTMSKCHIGKIGEKSSNWKGGITPINRTLRSRIEYRLWREAVFARDNWTCQKCGSRGVELNAHHIKMFCKYEELRTSISNGLTLCKNCHKEIHKKDGTFKATQQTKGDNI